MGTIRLNYSTVTEQYGIDYAAFTEEEREFLGKVFSEMRSDDLVVSSQFSEAPVRLKQLIESLFKPDELFNWSIYPDTPSEGEQGSRSVYFYGNARNKSGFEQQPASFTELEKIVSELWDTDVTMTTSNYDGYFNLLLLKVKGFHPNLEQEIVDLVKHHFGLDDHLIEKGQSF